MLDLSVQKILISAHCSARPEDTCAASNISDGAHDNTFHCFAFFLLYIYHPSKWISPKKNPRLSQKSQIYFGHHPRWPLMDLPWHTQIIFSYRPFHLNAVQNLAYGVNSVSFPCIDYVWNAYCLWVQQFCSDLRKSDYKTTRSKRHGGRPRALTASTMDAQSASPIPRMWCETMGKSQLWWCHPWCFGMAGFRRWSSICRTVTTQPPRHNRARC